MGEKTRQLELASCCRRLEDLDCNEYGSMNLEQDLDERTQQRVREEAFQELVRPARSAVEWAKKGGIVRVMEVPGAVHDPFHDDEMNVLPVDAPQQPCCVTLQALIKPPCSHGRSCWQALVDFRRNGSCHVRDGLVGFNQGCHPDDELGMEAQDVVDDEAFWGSWPLLPFRFRCTYDVADGSFALHLPRFQGIDADAVAEEYRLAAVAMRKVLCDNDALRRAHQHLHLAVRECVWDRLGFKQAEERLQRISDAYPWFRACR